MGDFLKGNMLKSEDEECGRLTEFRVFALMVCMPMVSYQRDSTFQKEELKMRKTRVFLGFVLVALILSGAVTLFAGDIKGAEIPVEPAGMPEADAAALWSHIHSTSPYWNWAQWPGKSGLYKGTEPHGVLLQTFVTDGVHHAVQGKTGVAPDRGIVVKENYTPDKTLAAITVMYKVKGFNPEAADWFWAKYAPDGQVQAAGKAEMCIKCHGAKKENDYFMTGPIK